MKKAELVFIPTPGISHLVSTVEVAKLLVDRDERLSITFLIMKLRSDPKIDRFINSVSTACNRIRFIDLPKDEPDPNQPRKFLFSLIEAQIPHVKEEVFKLVSQSESSPDSPPLAGFVLDMFCTSMIDVATEFGVPSYIFFTSGAAFLGLQFYVQDLHDEQKVDPTEFKGSDAELVMPCLANPLPAKVLPSVMLNKEWLPPVLLNFDPQGQQSHDLTLTLVLHQILKKKRERNRRMKKAELVFIPTPVISHLASTVEVAKLLVDRDERFSITFLIMKLRFDPKIDRFINSVSTACNRIRFIDLPKDEPDPNQPRKFLFSLIEAQIPHVKEEVFKLVSQSESSPDSPPLAGCGQ
ncbi:PREDICTED: UDP-glucose flavonoid 3-O-glucosyltransferase 6-like [Populus euphratica]|uniref:UDP-glucose flavonoid 3-O-glucosyltransferase 6-like n=1 Tax=Populus euphratica TaxID=75702 RepID=A0AAJ6XDY5_POPEU|nr:PREDICTED: UDP-glucose flavonoid 3-O-glucosyltransferase 6-like [Populus euphratica]